MYKCVVMHKLQHMYDVRGQLAKLVLSIHYMAPGNQIQIAGLGSKYLYLWSQLLFTITIIRN